MKKTIATQVLSLILSNSGYDFKAKKVTLNTEQFSKLHDELNKLL